MHDRNVEHDVEMRLRRFAPLGALLVTALALILDALLAFAVWASVPGTGRLRRMPQPLLGDEVVLESGQRLQSSSVARYERGDPSPTVEA